MGIEGSGYNIILSKEAHGGLARHLLMKGYGIVSFAGGGAVSPALADHPDMFICKMGAEDDAPLITYHNDERNKHPGFRKMSAEYPGDIAYNAACTGKFLIHNLKYTAPHIIEYAERSGMTLVHVKQGYAKCSTVIVDGQSVITYDRGISKACSAAGMDVLTINPGHIVLPGYDTGFIGGASGRAGDTIYFNGDLSAHPDGKAIMDFIRERGLEVIYFEDYALTDTGSMIIASESECSKHML